MRRSDLLDRLADAGATSDELRRVLIVPGAGQNEPTLAEFEKWQEMVRRGEEPRRKRG